MSWAWSYAFGKCIRCCIYCSKRFVHLKLSCRPMRNGQFAIFKQMQCDCNTDVQPLSSHAHCLHVQVRIQSVWNGGAHRDAYGCSCPLRQGSLAASPDPPSRLVGPGVVIDITEKANGNPDYGITVDDLKVKWSLAVECIVPYGNRNRLYKRNVQCHQIENDMWFLGCPYKGQVCHDNYLLPNSLSADHDFLKFKLRHYFLRILYITENGTVQCPSLLLLLQDWESQNGKIPSGAVVLMRSGWGSRYPIKERVLNTKTWKNPRTFHFPGH